MFVAQPRPNGAAVPDVGAVQVEGLLRHLRSAGLKPVAPWAQIHRPTGNGESDLWTITVEGATAAQLQAALDTFKPNDHFSQAAMADNVAVGLNVPPAGEKPRPPHSKVGPPPAGLK